MAGLQVTNDSKFALDTAKSLGLRLTSGYRTPQQNASAGGSKNSHHLTGEAYDFAGSRDKMFELAEKLKKSGRFKAIYFNDRDYISGRAVSGHQDHVHVAWSGKGSSSPKGSAVDKGDTGTIVGAIQKLLGSIKVDGLFGDSTYKAVEQFQEKHGLTADGSVGTKTWDKLTGGGSLFFMR
jgi:peptidoglycan hydrolase-like protein with peptidoglycan-binding domain